MFLSLALLFCIRFAVAVHSRVFHAKGSRTTYFVTCRGGSSSSKAFYCPFRTTALYRTYHTTPVYRITVPITSLYSLCRTTLPYCPFRTTHFTGHITQSRHTAPSALHRLTVPTALHRFTALSILYRFTTASALPPSYRP